jgi:hypothetical protein
MAEQGDHIKPLRLFDIARESGSQPTEEERKHIRECDECAHIIEVFARQFNKLVRPPDQANGGNAA